MASSTSNYKKQLKKGVTEDDARRRRQQTTVSLRKEKREEGLQKRRNLAVADTATDSAGTTSGHSPDLSLDNLPIYCEGENLKSVLLTIAHGFLRVRSLVFVRLTR